MSKYSNIYNDGTYFSNNPTWDVGDSTWKAEIIERLIDRNGIIINDLVDVGCGAGGILKLLAERKPQIKTLKGYDISPQAIKLADQSKIERVDFYLGDFVNDDLVSPSELILVIDVLEHVEDYYGFLSKLRTKGEYFIFHIPLDLSCRTLMKPQVMLQQRESVGHIHYFSEEMVWWFLKDTGYDVVDWEYTKPIVDKRKSGSPKQSIKKLLRNFSFGINKKFSARLWGDYSLMILAKRTK